MRKGYRLIVGVNCRAESSEHEANLWPNQASEVDGVGMTQGQTARRQSYRVFLEPPCRFVRVSLENNRAESSTIRDCVDTCGNTVMSSVRAEISLN